MCYAMPLLFDLSPIIIICILIIILIKLSLNSKQYIQMLYITIDSLCKEKKMRKPDEYFAVY